MYRFLFLIACSALFSAQIELGDQVLNVEIADTPESRAKGLMGRKSLAEGDGMLFIYPKAERLNFWMKNTVIPLSIGFFDKERVLINIADMEPITGTARSAKLAVYALEVPQGWFSNHRIEPGVKFSFLDQ